MQRMMSTLRLNTHEEVITASFLIITVIKKASKVSRILLEIIISNTDIHVGLQLEYTIPLIPIIAEYR